MPTEILGVILAGGASRRMGGGDKTALDLGGRTMLDHVHARLRSQVGAVIINSNATGVRHWQDCTVIADSLPNRPGPLAGVLAGMQWAAGNGYDQIVTVAGDTPFFPGDLVVRLRSAAGGHKDRIVLAATQEHTNLRRHPTFGLWPVTLRGDLERAVRNGTRKVVAWVDRHPSRTVAFAAAENDPFFNVNTPEDLACARRMLNGGTA